jgi:N-acetylglucosaminyldiphosphoundecaprenol N-acetyl-beta-D-mannosaminyltransferase
MSSSVEAVDAAPRGPEPTDTHALERARRVRIMGAEIAAVTEANAVHMIVGAATAIRGHWTITVNLDHLRLYQSDPVARELINEADLLVADGTPLIWASRLAGVALPERVAGSNMIWSLSEAASRQHASVFLVGGNPGVAKQASRVLQEHYTDLEIVGTLCPPLGFEDDEQELDRIQRQLAIAAPHIVFVGLPFPKQELLIRRLRAFLPHASFIGVGKSFSFVAGDVSRAPGWMHGLGLEWCYRLAQEPRRLIRRYLLQGVPFALRMLASAIRYRVRRRRNDSQWGLLDRNA